MQIEQLKTLSGQVVEGPLLITPQVFNDARGFFFEGWNQCAFDAAVGQVVTFNQDNYSFSYQGVLRGLHYQLNPMPQAKLIRCLSGEVFDVVVDLRKRSSTFGRWVGTKLTAANLSQLWVPVGFAHGFLVLSETASVSYKVSGLWDTAYERSLYWDDPKLAIQWPLDWSATAAPVLSEKDGLAFTLDEAIKAGEVFP